MKNGQVSQRHMELSSIIFNSDLFLTSKISGAKDTSNKQFQENISQLRVKHEAVWWLFTEKQIN
jgi:hypothetical protein